MRKPSVKTKCVANSYAAPDERIIEFSSEAGGGLIAFRVVDGTLRVDLYCLDKTVEVVRPVGRQAHAGTRRPGAVSLRGLVTLLIHVAALVVMLGIATDRTRAPECAVDRVEGDWLVVERVDGTTYDAHRDVLPDAVEGSYVPCEATEQAAAEHAYRGDRTFCEAHPEVPFCRED